MLSRGLMIVALSACTSPAAPPRPAPQRIVAPPRIPAPPPPAPAPKEQPAPFRIDRRVESYETFVDARPTDAPCPSIDWRPRPKLIRLEPCRDRPFAEQVDLFRDLVRYLRSTEGSDVDTARLLMGTDFVAYPEAVRRMIDHARTKPFRPGARGGIHKYITTAATERDLFPELATIFSPRKPVLVSSEGCSYGSSKGRDYGGDWLRSEKIEGFNLPLGCLSSMFDLRE